MDIAISILTIVFASLCITLVGWWLIDYEKKRQRDEIKRIVKETIDEEFFKEDK